MIFLSEASLSQEIPFKRYSWAKLKNQLLAVSLEQAELKFPTPYIFCRDNYVLCHVRVEILNHSVQTKFRKIIFFSLAQEYLLKLTLLNVLGS